MKVFCCLVHCGEGWRGDGGVALGGSGGAGEEGVEDVVDEGLLLESGWYGTGMWSCREKAGGGRSESERSRKRPSPASSAPVLPTSPPGGIQLWKERFL